jgi:hypothetical protein
MKYQIAIHVGSQNAVFLYGDLNLLGGWFDIDSFDAARIAAEVLKVALPKAEIVGGAAALTWWNQIKTIETCLDENTKRMIGVRTEDQSRPEQEALD